MADVGPGVDIVVEHVIAFRLNHSGLLWVRSVVAAKVDLVAIHVVDDDAVERQTKEASPVSHNQLNGN